MEIFKKKKKKNSLYMPYVPNKNELYEMNWAESGGIHDKHKVKPITIKEKLIDMHAVLDMTGLQRPFL